MSAWIWLGTAILAEIVATSALKLSDGFHRFVPSLVVTLGYAAAFYGLSVSLKSLPLGLVYAIWSGIGTIGALFVGRWLFGEALTWLQYAGAAVVVVGVVLMNTSRQGVV